MYELNFCSNKSYFGVLRNRLLEYIPKESIDDVMNKIINSIVKHHNEQFVFRKTSEIDPFSVHISVVNYIKQYLTDTTISIREIVEKLLNNIQKLYYFSFSGILVSVDENSNKYVYRLNRCVSDESIILVNEIDVNSDAMISLVSELRVEAKMISKLFDTTGKGE